MEYTTEIDGSEYKFDIEYRMGEVDNGRGGTMWGVEYWYISHVENKRVEGAERARWTAQLDEEDVINEIMEWES